ncbi:hypothetical protein [Pandoraea sp. NPDC087047]|uniref:hypothetical protein n=1 Tax=Pandoraea sp. NPDC087047 TaxID=3364390 RepID=UPI003808DB7B
MATEIRKSVKQESAIIADSAGKDLDFTPDFVKSDGTPVLPRKIPSARLAVSEKRASVRTFREARR